MKQFLLILGSISVFSGNLTARGEGGGGGGGVEEHQYQTYRPQNSNPNYNQQRYNDSKSTQPTNRNPINQDPNSLRNQAQQYQNQDKADTSASQTTSATKPLTPTQTTPQATPASVNATLQQSYPQMGSWFGGNFWAAHGLNPYYNTPGANWWEAPSWQEANGLLNYGWGNPVYYDPNGSTTTVTTPANSTTASNATTSSNSNIASSNSNTSSSQWIPLGVYAVGTDGLDASKTTQFLQLALNKNGAVAGTYYDTTTDKAHQVKGKLDKATQSIDWHIPDMPDSPAYSTGLYNLTQDQTAVSVLMPDATTNTWILTKLKNDQKKSN